jgi:putative glutamine amidotransferase
MGVELTGRPLIGVTTSEVRPAEKVDQTPEGEPPLREMALGLRYAAAVEAAGGLPVVLPPLSLAAVEPLLDRLSGLCLSGGPDLDPEAYNARRHPRLGPTEPQLDRFELGLARAADARGLPLLAICRGAQALNIVRGGTLHQHLPDDGPEGSAIEHRQTQPSEEPAHPVEIQPGSLLARLVGSGTLEVNSFHHQAAARLGRGLTAVAWAPDGVIEAIEDQRREFALGVQWHAECMAERPEQAALFSGLVDAARAHDSRWAGTRAA